MALDPSDLNIRSGPRSIRPEYYILIHKLKNQHIMSENQSQGAIIEVANTLFVRNWKPYNKTKKDEKGQICDFNTLPSPTNTNRTEPYIEALILSGIVNEIMDETNEIIVTYSNDGSALNRVGSFIVKSFCINDNSSKYPLNDLLHAENRFLVLPLKNIFKNQNQIRKYVIQ